MKKAPIIAALALGAANLAGCAELQQAESFITSPQNQATIAVLSTASIVFVCDVSAIANVTQQVEQAAGAAQSILGTTGKVFAASSVACTGLGGLLGSTMNVPAGTAVVQ